MKRNADKSIKSNALLTTALATGIASTANAAVVQVTLTNNRISSTGGNSLNADLTGDGNFDISITNPFFQAGRAAARINGNGLYAAFSLSGNVSTTFVLYYFRADARFNSGVGQAGAKGLNSLNLNYLNTVSFTDASINGGAVTQAWLQVEARSNTVVQSISLTKLIYDSANPGSRPSAVHNGGSSFSFTAVPEPSSFALLALGGAGVLLRRNRRKAA